jgi:hypothetical protein
MNDTTKTTEHVQTETSALDPLTTDISDEAIEGQAGGSWVLRQSTDSTNPTIVIKCC